MASLEPEHAQYITDAAVVHLRWLNRLRTRLQAHRVAPDDPLMLAVADA